MNTGGCRGRQSAVPELHESGTSGIPVRGMIEDLLGLNVQEAQPHAAMADDAFEMPDTAAAA